MKTLLTSAELAGYPFSALEKNSAGFDSLTGAANEPLTQRSGFFTPDVPSMGGSGGEPQGSPVLHRSVNPPDSAHPFDSGRRSANQTGAHHMNEITLAVKDGNAVTTSNVIADHFGKMHKDVLKKIRNLGCSEEFSQRNFAPIDFIDKNGDVQPAYEITRDGFTILCMGFTGDKAMAWKERYILAFNAMEAQLQKNTSNAALPYSVNPGDTLSKEQADELRDLVKSACLTLPKEQQAGFNIKVWSKLKSHFGVSYREIPAAEFSEALAITARHIVDSSAIPQELTREQIKQAAVEAVANTHFLTKFRLEAGKLVPIMIPIESGTYAMTDRELAGYISSPGHVPRELLPAIIQAAAGRLS